MAVSQNNIPQLWITKIRLKMTYLKFHPNFPWANDLNEAWGCWWIHLKSLAWSTQYGYISFALSIVIMKLPCRLFRVLNLASERYIITDSDLEALAQLPNLQELNISHQNEITDIGLRSLATQGSLTRLEMAYCHQVSDQGRECSWNFMIFFLMMSSIFSKMIVISCSIGYKRMQW